MKSLVWTAPRKFEMREDDVPSLTDGEALLKVKFSGICGSELSGYLGENSLRKPPLVMGHEFSGEIVSFRGDIGDFRIGDVVTANPLVECGMCSKCISGRPQHCEHREFIGISLPGAYAEYVKVPIRSMLKVTDPILGTLVEPLACSLRAVRQGGITLGENIVVFGAGIIGLFALKLAEVSGASKRVLVDTNPERLEIGRNFGATNVINASEQDIVSTILDDHGHVDCVIDAVGAAVVRQQAIQIVDGGGTIVFIGLHDDETILSCNTVVRNEISIVGSFSYSHDDFKSAHNLLENHFVMNSDDWLDIRSLAKAQDAFEEQINGSARFPKIILRPTHSLGE